MLKIKDDVNLKELEKFGFEEERLDYAKYNGNTYCVRISKENREIDINGYEDYDVIYDLIQAGLVKKEEEIWKKLMN